MQTLPQNDSRTGKPGVEPRTHRAVLTLDEDAYLRLKVAALKSIPPRSQSEIVSEALKQVLPAVEVAA